MFYSMQNICTEELTFQMKKKTEATIVVIVFHQSNVPNHLFEIDSSEF